MDLQALREFESDTKALVPGFGLAWKDESFFHRVLGWLMWPFNPKYMTSYTTTMYPRVWFVSKAEYEKSPLASFMILAHERVHLLDTQASPFWFRVSYLMPQVLAAPLLLVGVVLAITLGWWSTIAFILAVVALVPWPSRWRVEWEQRGYAMSMAVRFWLTGDLPVTTRDAIRKQFLGSAYFWMARDPVAIDKWLMLTANAIRTGTIQQDPVYGAVYRFLRERNLTTA